MTQKIIKQVYVGVDNDENGGLTNLGRIVLDAWMLGLIPETETCKGWDSARMQSFYEKVHTAWQPYAHLPSRLPDDLREKHSKLYAEAISKARKDGWDAELSEEG